MGVKEGEIKPQTAQQARKASDKPSAHTEGGVGAGGRIRHASARAKTGENARRRGQRGHLSFLSKTIRTGDASGMEEQIEHTRRQVKCCPKMPT